MNYLKPTYRIFLLRSKMSFSCHCYFSVLVFVAHSDIQLGASSTLQTPKYSYFLQRANELANKYNRTIPLEFTCDHTFVNEWNDAGKKTRQHKRIHYRRQRWHAYSTLTIYIETLWTAKPYFFPLDLVRWQLSEPGKLRRRVMIDSIFHQS